MPLLSFLFPPTEAKQETAIALVVDAKIDYPSGTPHDVHSFLTFPFAMSSLIFFIHSLPSLSTLLNLDVLPIFLACNAAETLLLHESTIESGLADKILRALRIAGVTLYGY